MTFAVLLTCSGTNFNQANAGYQRDSAQNRRDWKGILGLVGDLNRTRVDIFFLMGEGDSAGSKSDDAKDDEEYSNDGGRLHEGS